MLPKHGHVRALFRKALVLARQAKPPTYQPTYLKLASLGRRVSAAATCTASSLPR